MTFKYDSSEKISHDGYLTPVYFNKQVLIRYFYDPRFYCDFASETYGTIGDRENSFSIPFGININGSVIMWLGDIKKNIPIREQIYLLVENKEPEREVASEFYDAQINSEFTALPLEIQALNEVEKLNSTFQAKYSCFLYKERSIEERIDDARRYKRTLMNDEDDFKRFISDLNEIINESTNNSGLRGLLRSNNIQFEKGSKGNKLLEKVYNSLLGDVENNISPFFYLYDLRLWADHSGKGDILPSIKEKLGLSLDVELKIVLDTLLNSILESSKNLMRIINA